MHFKPGGAVPFLKMPADELGNVRVSLETLWGRAAAELKERLLRVLALIERGREIDWADVAVAGGYYDQAHFIHDFRAFSGINPIAYLRADVRERNHVVVI